MTLIQLHDIASGKQFASFSSAGAGFSSWAWVEDHVREYFDCSLRDEIKSFEDDDGVEWVTLNGTAVAWIGHSETPGWRDKKYGWENFGDARVL